MKSRLSIAILKSTFREKANLVWLFAFPVAFYAILLVAFSGVQESEIKFQVAFFEQNLNGMQTSFVKEFKDGFIDNESFIVSEPATIEEGLELLKNEKLKAFAVFSSSTEGDVIVNDFILPKLTVYKSSRNQLSVTTADILKRAYKKAGVITSGSVINNVVLETEFLGKTEESVSTKDLYLPAGIILGIFFSLFSLGGDISWYRNNSLLKRLSATPMTTGEYILSAAFSRFLLMFASIAVLFIFAVFGFGASTEMINFQTLFYCLLGSIFGLSLGTALGSFFNSQGGVVAMGNVFFLISMFLGGVFVPVSQLPSSLGFIIKINPITYIRSGILEGVVSTGYSSLTMILIPVLWIVGLLSISFWKLRKEVEAL